MLRIVFIVLLSLNIISPAFGDGEFLLKDDFEGDLSKGNAVEATPTPEKKPDRWQFNASTFGWFPDSLTIRADTDVGTFKQQFGLKQIMKMYRGGGMIHFTARRNKFGLFADLSYGDVEHSGTATTYGPGPRVESFPVEDNIQCGILQIGGSYRFGAERLSFDGLVGVRYMYVKANFALDAAQVESQNHFIEPLLGGKLDWRLSKGWSFLAQTSVSGFGLGTELTTDSEARIAYKISNKVNCYLGYRILDTKYEQKAGNLVKLAIQNNRIPSYTYKDIGITVKCMIKGPVLGVELRW